MDPVLEIGLIPGTNRFSSTSFGCHDYSLPKKNSDIAGCHYISDAAAACEIKLGRNQ